MSSYSKFSFSKPINSLESGVLDKTYNIDKYKLENMKQTKRSKATTTTSNKMTTAQAIIENPVFKRTKRRCKSTEEVEQRDESDINQLFDCNSQDLMEKLRLYKGQENYKTHRPQSAIEVLPQLKLENNLTQRPSHRKSDKEHKFTTLHNEEFNITLLKREYEKIVGSNMKEVRINEFRQRPETARTTLTTMKCYNQEFIRPSSTLYNISKKSEPKLIKTINMKTGTLSLIQQSQCKNIKNRRRVPSIIDAHSEILKDEISKLESNKEIIDSLVNHKLSKEMLYYDQAGTISEQNMHSNDKYDKLINQKHSKLRKGKHTKAPKTKRSQIDHKFADFYFAHHSKLASTKSSCKSLSRSKLRNNY